MQKILVTGAAGFVGRELCQRLTATGLHVVAAAREPAAVSGIATDTVRLDVGSSSDWAKVPTDITDLVHVAAVLDAEQGISPLMACNVSGAVHALDFAERHGLERIINLSTVSVHGDVVDPVIETETPSRAPGLYGASKLTAETIFGSAQIPRLVASLRLPGVLGPGAHRAWIPVLAQRLLKKKEVAIFNSSSPFNNAIHTDSLTDFIFVLLHGGDTGRFNFPLATKEPITIRDVATLLAEALGVPESLISETASQGRNSFTIAISDQAVALGYKPWTTRDAVATFARNVLHDHILDA